MTSFEFDAFICHASEDKASVAVPLAKALTEAGRNIWFDEMTLKIGDNLRRKIDEGLSKSRYGIVILSPAFFRKQWPQYELDGLISRELADAVKVILPVWHEIDAHDIRQFSLPLSVRLGGRTADGLEKLTADLLELIGGDSDIQVPEVSDDISLCKQAILTGALKDNKICVMPDTLNSGRCVSFNRYSFNDSEKQRKLYLHSLDELQSAGLVEYVSGIVYELTYSGIQAAERMSPIENPEKLGL